MPIVGNIAGNVGGFNLPIRDGKVWALNEPDLPRDTTKTLSSPTSIILDTLGQYVKNIRIITTGAAEIDVYAALTANIDAQGNLLVPDFKDMKFIGELVFDEPKTYHLPDDIASRIIGFRYIILNKKRGAPLTATLYSA